MGTNGGLLRRQAGRFHLYTAAEGLMAENIYQVISDEVGFVWMGTSRGLFRVATAELEDVAAGRRGQVSPAWFDTSDERRDLTIAGVRQPGVWRALDGRLWFGFDHGVVVVDPRRPHVNTRPPAVLIEEALVDGRAAPIGTLGHFPAGPGNLEFRFAALTLVEPRKAQLRYRLEGFDPRWIDAGGRRGARYIRVPAGQYRFRVQGANADGVWNEAGAAVDLRIAPHFHRTIWFYLLCAVAVLSLAWLLYRSRVSRLRRDYLAAFTERSRVARELHDTLLQSMAAVAMHLRGVRRKLEPVSAPASRELETIENMVTLSLEETRRFVWNLREQPIGSGDLGRALGQLAERIAAGRSPRAEVEVRGEVVALPNNVQGDLFRIAQEAIANAVKHAQAQRIQVLLEYQPHGARLRVSDDGQGFDPATAQGASAGHFGLVGMRERAARLGTFTLDARPGHGTTVEVTVQSGPKPSSAIDSGSERERRETS
jgi:signal transduction histidine kinase